MKKGEDWLFVFLLHLKSGTIHPYVNPGDAKAQQQDGKTQRNYILSKCGTEQRKANCNAANSCRGLAADVVDHPTKYLHCNKAPEPTEHQKCSEYGVVDADSSFNKRNVDCPEG